VRGVEGERKRPDAKRDGLEREGGSVEERDRREALKEHSGSSGLGQALNWQFGGVGYAAGNNRRWPMTDKRRIERRERGWREKVKEMQQFYGTHLCT